MDMRGESREYYHICTEGLEKKLLFRDRRDYIYGMNSIPVCALKFNVSVLAFCLMDNHVHFITEGRYEECSAFINEYKRRCSQRLRSKYSEVQALHDLKVSIHHIDSEEYLLSSVAYVLRNPFSTGSKCLPFHYEWCSAGLYFRAGQKHRTAGEKQLADLPGYIMERRLQMRRIMLPGHYVINDEDMIVPECYVEIPAVEKVFASPKRFLYHMSRNLDREMKLSMGASGKIYFDDREMKTAMLQICSAEFNADSPDRLHMEDKCRLIIMMRKRYGASAKQLARLTGISSGFLEQLLQ